MCSFYEINLWICPIGFTLDTLRKLNLYCEVLGNKEFFFIFCLRVEVALFILRFLQ